ncbi:hypothetical protein HN615_14225 [Candidatus Woesearchaeota archaeon]|nr:hypothetical protein [Candidatus Woesearchaeota archaeon]
MAKTHSSLTGADLHDNKGIGVETSANFMTISQSTNILSASAASTASFGRFEGSGDSHFSGSVSFGGNMTFGDSASDSVSITADLTSHLIPNADATYDLGSTAQGWNDLHLGSGGVINLDGGDVTLTHSANTITVAGGTFAAAAITGTTIDATTDFTIGSTVITDDSIVMTPSTSDTITFSGATNGALAITTVDDAAAAANITITADGTVDINSAGLMTLDSGGNIALEPAGGSHIKLDDVIQVDSGVVTGATSITSTAFVGDITGDVTGNTSGTALTVTQAAQSAITSLGTLTTLSVDNITINGNTISSTAGTDLNITPLAGQQIVLDGAIVVDAGVVTGATSITSTDLIGTNIDGILGADTARAITATTIGCGAITSTGNLAVTGTITGDTSLTLDTTTLTTAELGVLDSVTAGTAAASKALVLDASKDIGTIRNLTIDGTFSDGNYTFDTSGNVSGLGTVGCGAITTSGNLAVTGTITGDTSLTLDTTTLTTAELGVLDSVTAGTAAASKALVLDGSKNIATIGTVGCGAITSTGNSSFAGGVTVGGDFTVNGSTVTVDATTLNVADKNITIASGSTSSATMDGAGLNFGLDAAVAQLAYRHSDTTLTSSVDLGAPQFHSSIATGTAPLTVQSTTVVANLNAATVAGKTMAEPGAIGGTTAAAGTFTDLTATANIDIDDSGGDGAMDGVIIGAATAASATFTTVNATTFDATTDFTIDGLVLTADTITNDAALSVVSTGLTLDASLDIALSADGGNVTMDDGTTTAFDFNVDDVELKIHDDAQVANYASIAVGDNGATTFTTVDADAAAANLQITADGTAELAGTTVTLDSGTNVVLSPADGSHIKLDDVIQVDSGVVTGATSITSTAFVGDITGDVTGTSDLVTITDKSDSVNYDVLFGNSTSAVYDDTGTLTYNPGTATLSATSASITYISASKVEVDSTSLTIGGTALTKTILDNLQSTSGTNTGDQNTFLTVVSDSGTATADATGDALSILGGTGITTAVDYGTDAVTITSAITAGDGLTLNTADIDIDAAQTTITSIINNGLSIGGYASHQLIDFSSDDMIKVSVNNVADEFRFAAGGTFHANSDVVAYSSTVASDMNLKENITDMKYGLDTVMQLRGVEYDWKREDMGHDVGVLAQEVESVIPEIVKEHEGLQGRPKFKAVDYNKLVPVLIESIKELKSQIDELKLIKN